MPCGKILNIFFNSNSPTIMWQGGCRIRILRYMIVLFQRDREVLFTMDLGSPKLCHVPTSVCYFISTIYSLQSNCLVKKNTAIIIEE